MSRSRTLVLLLSIAAAGGCATKKPRVEREPARYAPAESDERRLSRIQEKLDGLREKVETWIVQVEAYHAQEAERTELETSLEGLRRVRDRIDRLVARVNGPPSGGSLDDIEREVLKAADHARSWHERALRAMER